MPHADIIVYSTRVCGYCLRAKQLLQSRNLAFTEILIDQDPVARKTMEERAGRRTVPQIFIHDQHIGGFEELAALARSGELERLVHINQEHSHG